jgi:tetratricopeptide (TPR) repeat protein
MHQAQLTKTKIGRNDPCHCGSGRKFKQCCQPQTDVRTSRTPSVDMSVPGLLRAAIEHHQAGRLSQAQVKYRQILELAPKNPDALHLLGLIAHQTGRLEVAVDLISTAVNIKPSASMYYNLGVAYQAQGNMDAAVASYRNALSLQPDYAEAHSNLGAALQVQGRPDAAIESLRRAISFRPDDAGAHSNLGVAFQAQGQLDAAVESFRRALRIKPDHAETHSNLGAVLQTQGQLDAAVECCRQALAIKPDYAEAHSNLGLALHAQGQLDAAISSYHQAISIKPDHAEAHNNLSLALLLRGALPEGWREYEWRVQSLSGSAYVADPRDVSRLLPRPSTRLPIELQGKRVLLVPEQGLGDEIFFLRFARVAQQRGAWLAYLPSAKIAGMVQRAPGIDSVIRAAEIPANLDQIVLVGELPLILGVQRLDELPPALPLTVLLERSLAMKSRLAALGDGPFLGVTWRAGTERTANHRKPLLYKEADCSLLGCALSAWPGKVLILQRNPRAQEIEEFMRALGRPVYDLSDVNENLEDMLALLALLDDYVGVSNTNMHLMAGLGKPARVLIPNPPEWRWMAEGHESPWFPGFKLYRQQQDGEWSGALYRLTEDLQNRAN